MDVDFDLAWLKLKAVIAEKRSHGQDSLFNAMSRIEVECAHDPAISGTAASTRQAAPEEDAPASPSGMPETAHPLAAKEAANGSRRDNGAVHA